MAGHDITLLPIPAENPEKVETREEAETLAEALGAGVAPEYISFYTFVVATAMGRPQDQVAFRVARTLNITTADCMGVDIEEAVFCVQWLNANKDCITSGPDYVASQLNAAMSEIFQTPGADRLRPSYVVAASLHPNSILQGHSVVVIDPKVANSILTLLLEGNVSEASKQSRSLEETCPDCDHVALGTSMDDEMFLDRLTRVDSGTLRHFARTYGLNGPAVFLSKEAAALPTPDSGRDDSTWELGEALAPPLAGTTLEALWNTYVATKPPKTSLAPLDWFPIVQEDGLNPFEEEEEEG